MLELANSLFAYGTLAANLGLVVYVVYFFIGREDRLARAVGQHAYVGVLLVAMVSLVGSLYYSDVVGWEPCVLCWYQRIVLYPIVPLMAIAIYRREPARIAPYVAFLASVGLAIALYHVYIQFGPPAHAMAFNGCGFGDGVPCSETYNVAFGYISMATSALTAFLLVLVGLRLGRRAEILDEQRAA